jgi:hypothetical protein
MRDKEDRPDLPRHLTPTIVTCIFILILGFLLCCVTTVDRRGAVSSDEIPDNRPSAECGQCIPGTDARTDLWTSPTAKCV